MKRLCIALCLVLCACRRGMVNQQRVNPLAEENFFSDGAGARPIPRHTVARGHLDANEPFFTGKNSGILITELPIPVNAELLSRGRQRFEIYCAVCHARTGEGNGMIVQRGFPPPPSFHDQRLVNAPIGHFFDVITNGYGVMYPYASRVEPADRWAIAAYIRALQFSRRATPDDVPPEERTKLEGMKQ